MERISSSEVRADMRTDERAPETANPTHEALLTKAKHLPTGCVKRSHFSCSSLRRLYAYVSGGRCVPVAYWPSFAIRRQSIGLLHPVKGWIERPLLHAERIVGDCWMCAPIRAVLRPRPQL